jgi:hypothetical protein
MVIEVRGNSVRVGRGCGASWWMMSDHCRPVEPDQDDHPIEFKVGDRVVSWSGRQGVVEAISEIEGFPITVRHSMREQVSYKLGGVKHDDHPVEPSNSPEIPDSSNDPLAPSPCMDGVNVDRFVDGVMEARGRTNDPVNPSHYKQGGIECIEAIKAATGDGFVGYVWGNVLKYLWRWPKKGGVDDLKKARWYLGRLIKEVGE